MEGFALDKSYFTQEEQSNIIQALQILKSSHYPDADRTLNKVAGLFSHTLQSDWLEIDFSYWGSPEKERRNMTALERAVINKYVIKFTYYNSELTITEQTVEPLKLLFKSHSWYLIAFSLTPAYQEEYNIPLFKLRFSEKIAYKVYDEFQEEYIKKLEDRKSVV